MLLTRRNVKNNGKKKEVEIKKNGAYLDTVSFRQDVPERVVKLIEIHLMASPQQSLGVRSKSHFQALTEQPKKICFIVKLHTNTFDMQTQYMNQTWTQKLSRSLKALNTQSLFFSCKFVHVLHHKSTHLIRSTYAF